MGVLGEKCLPKWANFTLKQGENKKKHASSNFLSGMISIQGDGISSCESIYYWLMMLYHSCIINFMS